MLRGPYRFCPHCAQKLAPFTDGDQDRARCPDCGWVHYRNPTVGVAVVLIEAGNLLLGERRDGGWCIPCGHVEWDESIGEAAFREFFEETGLHVDLGDVIAVHSNFHNPDQHTVGVWFEGQRVSGDLRPGGDLIQVSFFPLDQLPPLKFPTDQKVVAQICGH